MDMEDDDVGSYSTFVARVGRASSEIREGEGATGDISVMMEGEERDRNIVNSSLDESDSDVDICDETTFVVTPPQPDPSEDADKTTLVIPPDEIQGFLREKGIHSRPRTGIKVKKDENGQFVCPICQHPFIHRTNAFHHTYTHMNQLELEKVNIYHQRCPYSPQKIFFSRRDYAQHINSHEGIKNFKCQICQKGFLQRGHLHDHLLSHANQGSEVQMSFPFRHFQCYFCHRKFGNMSRLISHISSHTKETPCKCSYCNKWFLHKSNMTSHIRHVHTHSDNPKPFPCPQCPKKWSERGQLNWHIKVVHGEKAHKCPDCSELFSTKPNLNRHVNGVHRKMRHQCPHCPKTYSTKTYMNMHMKKEHR